MVDYTTMSEIYLKKIYKIALQIIRIFKKILQEFLIFCHFEELLKTLWETIFV